jgi:Flp pilus assembly protein TadG
VARRPRSADGQATIEIALCLPILALLIALLVEAGGLATDRVRLWHAAREAARVAVVEPIEAEARAAAERSGLPGLEMTIEPGIDARVRGEPLTVTVTYRPGGRVPLIGRLFHGIVMRAAATMRIERP